MAPETPEQGVTWSESCGLTDASSNTPPTGTQQHSRQQLVHCDAANAANHNMTQDTLQKIIHKTANSENRKQHAIKCEQIYTDVDGGKLGV